MRQSSSEKETFPGLYDLEWNVVADDVAAGAVVFVDGSADYGVMGWQA